jgi:putative nucleotidyltransferase with HDIG domain
MLPQIIRHSELVAQVALYIGTRLNDEGMKLNLPLVQAGALLHDIAKTICLETSGNHAEEGGALLVSLGYPSVASIVRQHIRMDEGAIDETIITEIELVNYSDKRVKHEEVVDLEERFRDIHERYKGKFPGLEQALEQVLKETIFIEEKIFSLLEITPEDIIDPLFRKTPA